MDDGVGVTVQVAVGVGVVEGDVVSSAWTVTVVVGVGVAEGDAVGETVRPGVGPRRVTATAVAVPWSQVTRAVLTTVRPPQVL